MLSYKEWKELNESFGGPVPLGIGKQQAVGVVNSLSTIEDLESLEEAAKKKKKKMLADLEDKELEVSPDDVDIDVDVDDEEDDVCPGKDDEVDIDVDVDDEEEEEDVPPMMAKKKMKGKMKKKMAKKGCKTCKASSKKMTKEDQEWYNSVKRQVDSDPNRKYNDGLPSISEDALLAPEQEPEADQMTPNEPQPGEVGYAPEQKIGWFLR